MSNNQNITRNTTPAKPKKVNPATVKAVKASIKVNSPAVNTAFWGLTILLVAGVSVFNQMFAQQYNPIVRLLVVIGSIVLALGAFVLTNQGRSFVKFGLESLLELKKIYWPTRKEALITSIIVTVISVLTSFMFWFFDKVIQTVVQFITSFNL